MTAALRRGDIPVPHEHEKGEGWATAKIGDVVVKTSQRDPRKAPRAVFQYVDVSSVSNETFRITGSTATLGADAPSRARKQIFANDVLFATVRPTLKRIALVPSDLDGQIASTGYCVLRADEKRIDSGFLYYCLLTDSFTARMAGLERGVSYPAVSDGDVLASTIPLPPLPEQKRIAHILSTVQRAIEAQERIIQTTTELKKALMHKLFTEGTRGEKQKDSEIGPIPVSWEVVPLGEFAQAKGGFGFPISRQGRTEGKYPFYKVSDMNLPGNEKQMLAANNWIGDEDLAALKAKLLPPGTVVFPKIGATILTNKKRLLSRPSVVDNNVVGILIDDQNRCGYEFLYQWFQTVDLGRLANPGTVPSITSGKLCATLVPLPKFDEQEEIASALRLLDLKLQNHAAQRSSRTDAFRTLLHQLMTAKTRVHNVSIK